MATFKVNLKALPFDTQSVSYHLEADFFSDNEPAEVIAANVDAEVSVTRRSERDFALAIVCRGTLSVPCDRCLEPMEHRVEADYRLTVRLEGDELDDSRDGVLLVPEGWHELDIEPLVRDTVLLTIPVAHTHPEGGCDAEMLERLGQHLATVEPADDDGPAGDEPADPRWEALRKLKDEQ